MAEMETKALPVDENRLREFVRTLQRYSAGLRPTRQRIIASENWWKLRNSAEEQLHAPGDGGYKSVSGWLHNVIVSKHADLMEGYPEPVILPRERDDTAEARALCAILPCVLEQNGFDETYSDAMWQKCKTGTACYKVVWDQEKHFGLGDISIRRVNLLNLYWEPGVEDIQHSRFLFHTELRDRDLLEEEYPQLRGRDTGTDFLDTRFLYDDQVDTTGKDTVIEVYYHKRSEGKNTLQYCKFVGNTLLFATENEEDFARRGLYDHGRFPYEFDPLFPIEGSPCGYGYVDVCRSPQTEIDLMKTSFLKNAQVGAVPRFFSRQDGSVNEGEFLDLTRPIVHVAGNLGEDSLRQIPVRSLDGVYVNLLDRTIQELRETSGNTETSTGNISSGVTAASAIAALQEASGKGSRDTIRAGYRSFGRLMELCIELIRQFYDLPRKFRILGQLGTEEFFVYDNSRLKPMALEGELGLEGALRLPVFDIRVEAQKKTPFSRISQNELALQLYQVGIFDPQRHQQAVRCLEMMEFEGKEAVLRSVAENGAAYEQQLAIGREAPWYGSNMAPIPSM